MSKNPGPSRRIVHGWGFISNAVVSTAAFFVAPTRTHTKAAARGAAGVSGSALGRRGSRRVFFGPGRSEREESPLRSAIGEKFPTRAGSEGENSPSLPHLGNGQSHPTMHNHIHFRGLLRFGREFIFHKHPWHADCSLFSRLPKGRTCDAFGCRSGTGGRENPPSGRLLIRSDQTCQAQKWVGCVRGGSECEAGPPIFYLQTTVR